MDRFEGFQHVDIIKFQITSATSGRTMDIRRLLAGVEYYNSIYDPTIYMIADIDDMSGMLYDLPLIGDEIVEVEIRTPERQSIRKILHCFKPTDIVTDPNGSMNRFTLHMVSIDQMRATSNLIEQGFEGTVDTFVRNIMTDTVRTVLPLNIEPTRGIEKLLIPSWNCWETIEILRERAVSSKYDTTFFFFEDLTKYNFVSLEYLIEQRSTGEIIRVTAMPYHPGAGDGTGVNRNSTISPDDYRNATNFVILEKADIYASVNNGGVNNKTFVFDIMNKRVDEKTLSVNDLAAEIKRPLSKQYNKQFGKVVESNASQTTTNYIVSVDNFNRANYVDTINTRQMVNRHFNAIRVQFSLYGDSQLQAGNLIDLEVPRTSQQQGDDQQLTGRYVIANLKHSIVDNTMYTHITANKFGLSESVL